jgi:cellulose synthase/poly-beta-1,6-N-acetylglucosamine synthase-like glycosyltransferase
MFALSPTDQLLAGAWACTALPIAYHHLGYPMLLKAMSRVGRSGTAASSPSRAWAQNPGDAELPPITIVIPVYNEAAIIADKIWNIAALDYPTDKLRVIILCDGSTDGTVAVALKTKQKLGERGAAFVAIDYRRNRGKVAVLNDVLPDIESGLIMLTDASALISVDALLIAADHFRDPKVGIVAATYAFAGRAGEGEAGYWKYQLAIKRGEARLGAFTGAHGAGYFFRAELFTPLPADTINDDVILPMRIVKAGYRAIYEPLMVAAELDVTRPEQEQRRRVRIAAGNMQQLLRLRGLLSPRFGATAFAFASGKGLRAIVPFLLALLLALTAALAFRGVAPAQILVAAGLVLGALAPIRSRLPGGQIKKLLDLAAYAARGQWLSLIGGTRYVLGLERSSWRGSAGTPSTGK